MGDKGARNDISLSEFHDTWTLIDLVCLNWRFIMKIAVLGATGGTGIQVVKQALAAKHEVIAIVRNPDNLKEIQNSRLTVNYNYYVICLLFFKFYFRNEL